MSKRSPRTLPNFYGDLVKDVGLPLTLLITLAVFVVPPFLLLSAGMALFYLVRWIARGFVTAST